MKPGDTFSVEAHFNCYTAIVTDSHIDPKTGNEIVTCNIPDLFLKNQKIIFKPKS